MSAPLPRRSPLNARRSWASSPTANPRALAVGLIGWEGDRQGWRARIMDGE